MTLSLMTSALLLSFVGCCIASAALQVVAWLRHARDGAPVSLRALWRPDDHFDEIGRRQIRAARRLLTVGAVAYLSYGFLLIVSSVVQATP